MAEEGRPRPFHERFDIDVGADEARQRFLNRASNSVFDHVSHSLTTFKKNYPTDFYYTVKRHVANALGQRYDSSKRFEHYIHNDFRRCLQALEALYAMLEGRPIQARVSERIDGVIRDSEVDLGISWQPPMFVRTGAPGLHINYEQPQVVVICSRLNYHF